MTSGLRETHPLQGRDSRLQATEPSWLRAGDRVLLISHLQSPPQADSVTQLSFSAEPSLERMLLEGGDLTFRSLRGPNAWTVPGMQPAHTEYLGSTESTVSPEP